MFTWKPFFKEMALRLLDYRNRQDELIGILNQMATKPIRVLSRTDKDKEGNNIPLAEVDPFTVFASFCRSITPDNRKAQVEAFQNALGITAPLPTDFNGVPQANNQAVWFFAYQHSRKPDDVDALWQVADDAVRLGEKGLTDEAWRRGLAVQQVGLAKLTMGLFWVNPDAFLPTDQNVLEYARKHGVNIEKLVGKGTSLTVYRKFLQDVRQNLGSDFAKISYDAWQGNTSSVVIDPEVKEVTDTPTPSSLPIVPLNQILFGPPGTGKTYTTIEKAVKIIEGSQATHEEAKKCWDRLQRQEKIEFVTFHQSYGYEDFVEGLRPVLSSTGQAPRYMVQQGSLKRIVQRALSDALEPIPSPIAPFDKLWQDFLDRIKSDRDYKVAGLSDRSNYQPLSNTVTNRGLKFRNTVSNVTYGIRREYVAKVFATYANENTINSAQVESAMGKGGHHSLIAAIFQALKQPQLQGEDDSNERASKPGLLDYVRLGEASGYRLKANPPRYVLVIDEINRGNISRILGELITLLEEDKRLGAANALSVNLPFSGETFALPPNLYILGTMNTADKSIALVDIALRRRFTFTEMRPRFTNGAGGTCPGMTDEMCRLMTEMNRRILLRKDRDHRIGHAYFANVNDETEFDTVIRNCILPLLSEYFWGDWDGLRYVLGETGSDGIFIRRISGSDAPSARNKWQWYFDADEDTEETFDALATLKANYAIA